ncbi:MAG: CoB--CoM heterodisulfide reductase iron-sulfur subunit A family protein [Candidatus Bipolaricaulota bacterium]|nr:CoB--CoM heterodisulfide reductase iron-sulfur subunit A family protein [Candidatus Bipolaricaulota bacterium]
MSRIGVFVCHCGMNIEETVDTGLVAEALREYAGVVHAEDYDYMCSEIGQQKIRDAIVEHNLDGVVVASCTPSMHQETFRNAAEEAGLNRYRLEVANIREQVSWVHSDRQVATQKAIRMTRAAVEKVRGDDDLSPIGVDHETECLVVGGGITGIQAALDVANSGHKVTLVERDPSIGGHMAQLAVTFPTLDCAQCILTPRMVEASRHPNIELLTYSEVIKVGGYTGNYEVTISKNPTYVDADKCNLCDKCSEVCPVSVKEEFNEGLSERKAIYLPFEQAIPSSYVLDEDACLGVKPIRCGLCQDVCDVGAIDYDMAPETITKKVGAAIIATGYDLYDPSHLTEYGGGEYPDVVTSLQFERMIHPSGPMAGQLRRPSDGRLVKSVAFVHCAGSRDPGRHKPYCSRICCTYTAKHALLFKNSVPEGEASVFYIDIRTDGKGYEEFAQGIISDKRIRYIRGKVAKVVDEGDRLAVWGADTISGKSMEIGVDLVVLAMAMVPSEGTAELARTFHINIDENGFLKEAHPKLRPVETTTAGVFIAGTVQGPKDIPDSVAQGSAAASKAIAILSAEELSHSPEVASVSDEFCSGCGICESVCPYAAVKVERSGIAVVNEILCSGCGICAAACPAGAIEVKNERHAQIEEMIAAALGSEQ